MSESVARPSAEVIRDRSWQLALGLTTAAVLFGFFPVLRQLWSLWTSNIDYSHGLLIVPFMGYLLWTRADQFPRTISRWPDWRGVPFLVLAVLVYLVENQIKIAMEWVQAAALTVAFAGIAVMFCGGWAGLRWVAPALLFLPLAFQLPMRVEQRLMFRLRGFATDAGNFVFQSLGFPSYTQGNIIVIGETKLGVEQACSGLSMILAFVALSAAIAILYRSRPWIDRIMIFAAAVPIALFCNIVRIVVTGLFYHAGWTKFADLVVHDLAGWLMMPMALGLLALLVKLLDWVVEPVERLSTTEALGLPKVRSEVSAAIGPRIPAPGGLGTAGRGGPAMAPPGGGIAGASGPVGRNPGTPQG